MKEQKNDNPATPEEVTDRLWELADKIDICMLTTWTGKEQRSRPMSSRPRRAENKFYFLADVSGDANGEIGAYPTVSLAWADNSSYRYAVVSGHATVTNDRAKIAELWTKMDEAWWHGKDDPTIRLITVTPDRGEIWDSPGMIVSSVKMLVAAVTGNAPKMGDNAEVRM